MITFFFLFIEIKQFAFEKYLSILQGRIGSSIVYSLNCGNGLKQMSCNQFFDQHPLKEKYKIKQFRLTPCSYKSG